eukprot:466962-Amphidinium_carterae.2
MWRKFLQVKHYRSTVVASLRAYPLGKQDWPFVFCFPKQQHIRLHVDDTDRFEQKIGSSGVNSPIPLVRKRTPQSTYVGDYMPPDGDHMKADCEECNH